MKKWECIVCGLIYDEAKGWPEDGIAPGTRWEDVPEEVLERLKDTPAGKERELDVFRTPEGSYFNSMISNLFGN